MNNALILFAQAAQEAAKPTAQQGSGMGMLVPMLLIFAIFYFMMIRPQQRKEKKRRKEPCFPDLFIARHIQQSAKMRDPEQIRSDDILSPDKARILRFVGIAFRDDALAGNSDRAVRHILLPARKERDNIPFFHCPVPGIDKCGLAGPNRGFHGPGQNDKRADACAKERCKRSAHKEKKYDQYFRNSSDNP